MWQVLPVREHPQVGQVGICPVVQKHWVGRAGCWSSLMRVKVWKGHSGDESWAAQVRTEQMIPARKETNIVRTHGAQEHLSQ